MLIFDAHLDMAWNACEWNRDLELPVSEIRKFERQFENIIPGEATVSWHALRKGGVGMTISTLLPRLHRKDAALTHYQSREAAYGVAMGQLAYYRAMVEKGVLREIPDSKTLKSHVEEWEANEAAAREEGSTIPIGFILSMEGAPPILSPGQIEHWFDAGLRILGPAHYGPGPYCYGTGSTGGLKEEGPALLKEMDRVGMLLDVTHLADQSFWEALEIFQGPVLASHHNCRALVDADRQLTDEQIKALIERGAVIGCAFDNWMIKPGWTIGVSDPKTTSIEDIANHTDHICQLAGNAKHCGMGTDLDGGFGKEQTPHDLDTIADLEMYASILEKRGYSEADIKGIMSQNFIDFFLKALPAG
ncbi:dipeptidase [Gimesia chilikensis]|uniref:Membrane dipeptidase (Peptidase family M19) n=1 Tax=Gimesia chilikensis TaxID=2605989 RepID=A0A517PY75_9PLAN|nr:membrane dipeptidase [Gimesia chilikensis]QDT24323.1 Membrane dipeptidase (Peptidase family M19) [Gimesia chilikensis]